jgi:hypothetical protein
LDNVIELIIIYPTESEHFKEMNLAVQL